MGLRVSVIVPTFNRSQLLRDALDSVLIQSAAPFEIVVVDDGSTDATAQVAASYGGRVTYVRKENGGKATALNDGWARCAGEAVWILDDDDVASRHGLAALSAALEVRPDCAFAYGRHDFFSVGPNGERRTWPVGDLPKVEEDELPHALMERCFIFQPGTLFRRECFALAGGFDPTMVRSQDYDFLLRLALKARAVRVEEVVFHQRQHDGDRGTAAHAIPMREREAAWAVYDRKIFKKLRAASPLSAFVRPGSHGSPEGARLSGLLRRSLIMGHKGLWEEAGADLEEAAGLLEASAGAQNIDVAEFETLLGPYSQGLDLFPSATTYIAAIERISDAHIRNAVRAAILKPLLHQLRRALQRRDWDRVRMVWRCARAAGSVPAVGQAALRRAGFQRRPAFAGTTG